MLKRLDTQQATALQSVFGFLHVVTCNTAKLRIVTSSRSACHYVLGFVFLNTRKAVQADTNL